MVGSREMGNPADRPQTLPLSGWVAAAHVFALTGFAVAEPLFDLLSRQAELFVAHNTQPIDLAIVAIACSLVLPLVLVLLARSTALLSGALWWWVHRIQVTGLAGMIFLQMLKRLTPGLPGLGMLAASFGLAMLAGIGYARYPLCRTFLTILSPTALLFPLLFLFTSPLREMLLPATTDAMTATPAAPSAPVVMVILDELPLSSLLDESGGINANRYPNLASLAGGAHWFRDATTVANGTTLSVPIILSGRIPEDKHLPRATYYPHNLFTWLGAAGYRMQVFETHTRLCPPELCSAEPRLGWTQRLDRLATDLAVIYLHLLSPSDLATRLPAIQGTWRDFTPWTIGDRLRQVLGLAPNAATSARDADAPQHFARFLDAIAPNESPALHFIHVMLPHIPWRYLPSGKEYGHVGAPVFPHGVRRETWGNDEWQVTQGLQRHLLQVGYVDLLIGRLIARLHQQGLYDSSLIVVVADHGARFHAGGSRRGTSGAHFADILNVPLIVKLPGQKRGVQSDRNVETIDVLPTMAAALDLALPWSTDGLSALDPELPERPMKQSLVKKKGENGFLSQPLSPAAMRTERDRSVARKLRLFGSGDEPGSLFRIGRRADLLGRRVATLLPTDLMPTDPVQTDPVPPRAESVQDQESQLTVEIDQPWTFDEVDPASPFIPAHVTGRVRFAAPRDSPLELVIAINGKVEAVTRAFAQRDDRARFTAMVREEAFSSGRNLVEVFEIADRSPAAALLPTRRLSAGFALVSSPGGEKLQAADGSLIPLAPGKLKGTAKIGRKTTGTWLTGWAAVGHRKEPAETLLVFIDGRLALVTDNGLNPATGRVRTRDTWKKKASFKIQLPGAVVSAASEIRLLAVLQGSASEIAIR